MEAVKKGVYIIQYEDVNITQKISHMVSSVTYTDHMHGESDEIEITIEDSLNLWKSSWYPSKGNKIYMAVGWEGEKLMPCGTFQLDEMEFGLSPDTVSLRGIATQITSALRQKNSAAYENMTLEDVAGKIAANHGYTVVGDFEKITFARITQKQERDLAFLRRLAEAYGYIFKIVDTKLVFYKLEKIDASTAVHTLTRRDITGGSLRDAVRTVYKGAQVSYSDPKTMKTISHTVSDPSKVRGDIVKITDKVENPQQAEARAKAALYQANYSEMEGSLSTMGNTKLVAGSTVVLSGFDRLDGKYKIEQSRHIVDRSGGYKTDIDVRRLNG